MGIRYTCPKCDHETVAPERAAGTIINCAECGGRVKVPVARATSKPTRSARDENDRSPGPTAPKKTWQRFHALYIAPLVVTLIAGLVLAFVINADKPDPPPVAGVPTPPQGKEPPAPPAKKGLATL